MIILLMIVILIATLFTLLYLSGICLYLIKLNDQSFDIEIRYELGDDEDKIEEEAIVLLDKYESIAKWPLVTTLVPALGRLDDDSDLE